LILRNNLGSCIAYKNLFTPSLPRRQLLQPVRWLPPPPGGVRGGLLYWQFDLIVAAK